MRVNDISFWSPGKAFIEVSGPDSSSFLHRLSTQNLDSFSRGELVENCFLNSKGRLVDVVCQILVEKNRWILMSAHKDVCILKSWLEKYWFSEDIQIKKSVGFEFETIEESSRISRALSKAPNEINDSYHPLELGLEKLIAWNKGCYIGQEVISRLDTYDKVSRKLVALSCEEKDFDSLKQSLEITSSLNEFKKDQAVALGVVKKAVLTAEGFLTTANGTKAWVVSSAR